ncbi:phosphoenolpyruvate synthase [Azospirillum sp. RWY-5-1]|uniref:Phosphoenolpyruvate synthase n=1 Tax=Azospirillum oleiclasticum TaxID=2735135 RepID=A0ABX2TFQ1_9PROT|nr:phosphoenolpyruvate synthase [Azospirillum oleiclasticum]NYZ14868.1 phosphoenolpyruvate synthase [Azospirillum oleiclasticum]NYZ22146.1 phosphoenolpyruvate synthase [Azospirillum oleiclasticum]
MSDARYVRWFAELGRGDVPLVGGKNASLGELRRNLTPLGIPVPDGFALTADSFRDALTAAGAWGELHDLLDGLGKEDVARLARCGARARDLVYAAGLTPAAEAELRRAWAALSAEHGPDLAVAVRSSATAEDLPTASFAGQHETYLNVAGEANLLDAVKRCQASLFTDRAIAYRIDQGFDHFKVALSVGVQTMVRSDLAAAGVMFSIDTETGFPDVVFITGAYGLGETVVQGAVDPDEFYVHKPTWRLGARAVLRRRLGEKQVKMVYRTGRTREATRVVPTPDADRRRFCLTDREVVTLAEYAIRIEDHYGCSMDMEWAKDGLDGLIYVVQARPETVASRRRPMELESFVPDGRGEVLAQGRAVGARMAAGPVRIVTDPHHLSAFRPGEVLVADTTTPDWEPVMKTAAAIVTNRGGRTCHAAIVARELGIPAVVGAETATAALGDGRTVTVSCAEGEVGRVYDGAVPFHVERVDLGSLERPQTRIMVNIGNPEQAFQTAALPVDGVGLARMEFIISETIRAHPMALLHPERVQDAAERDRIRDLAGGHPDGAAFFVERLSEGIGTIAAAFHPRPVIVRLSDFKTNEYAALVGGRWFEPVEENPMLGFRGAARYAHEAYEEGFALECRALARVRDDMGLTNVTVMVPFCRRVAEAERVLATMARHGLERGRDGLEVYVMCEIPNNVLLIDEFSRLFDGFSIGSNDLTQLTLGVDRDSPLVAFDFDERDPGVLAFLRQTVEGARRNGRSCGICGQAPSDYPEIAEFLVRLGIGSMSLTPDSVLRTLRMVVNLEHSLGRPPRADA